jgi:hypothetical protein
MQGFPYNGICRVSHPDTFVTGDSLRNIPSLTHLRRVVPRFPYFRSLNLHIRTIGSPKVLTGRPA